MKFNETKFLKYEYMLKNCIIIKKYISSVKTFIKRFFYILCYIFSTAVFYNSEFQIIIMLNKFM